MLMKANQGPLRIKYFLSEDPLSVIEGMIIAGYLFFSKSRLYLYARRISQNPKTFQEALDNARQAGFLGGKHF